MSYQPNPLNLIIGNSGNLINRLNFGTVYLNSGIYNMSDTSVSTGTIYVLTTQSNTVIASLRAVPVTGSGVMFYSQSSDNGNISYLRIN